MSEAARWQAVRALFDEAVDLEGDARAQRLARLRAESPALAADVESLLEWDARPRGPLDIGLAPFTPAADDADALIGRELGAWRIVDVIGRGGMGVVYRAERADAAFRMPAAIKVVRSGGSSHEIFRRFVQERETLAALDHPNIARLLDGGTTPQGQPYLVMELVDGVPIDRYCDERKLTIDARLDLFRLVCDAVRYAHQALVVHRDIKPDNILVTRDGTPKLLDFGVAKLLSQDERPSSPDELAASWLLTPEYASPEQIRGRQVTTTADVYSLGVLLYVLLTGERPYVLSGRTPAALQAQLDDVTPGRPSAVATSGPNSLQRAVERSTTPARLAARLDGDLDAIVARALEPGPTSRYGSVDQLAGELERHRTLRPIDARAHELPYVLGRLARRHRAALSVAAAVLVLLVAAMAAIAWQARIAAEARSRAERRFADVRRLAQSFIFDVHDAIVNVPGTTEARGVMIRTAVSYLDSLAREAADDRSLQRELAAAYVKVGDAQGHPTSANLGDSAGARASYQRAIAIAESLSSSAVDLEATRTLARAHRQLADVLAWGGDQATALGHAQRSRQFYVDNARRTGATIEDQLQAAIGDIKLGDLFGNPNLPNLGRSADAVARYEEALTALRRLAAAAPRQERVRRYFGLVFERLGTMAETRQDWTAAEAAYRESFAIRSALAADVKVHHDIQRDLAVAFEKLGNVQRARNDTRASIESYRGALAQFERLADADSSNALAIRSVGVSREKLADALLTSGRPDEARTLLYAALTAYRNLGERDPENVQTRCDRRRVSQWLGNITNTPRATAAERREACALWRESDDVSRELRARGATGCLAEGDLQSLRTSLTGCASSREPSVR
jgi:eukaryotic-like serine/threonine-protein kinase